MSRELFSARPTDPAEAVVNGILALGITSAPVLDDDRRPIGVVSLRDLVDAERGAAVTERMTEPPIVVRESATIDEAARMVGVLGLRHLVVVDEDGRATGVVSAADLIRGLIGLPARHPAALPHLGDEHGLVWSDDTFLDAEHVEVAPEGPGILALIHDVPGKPKRVVWVELARNVRKRVFDLVSVLTTDPRLTRWLGESEHLWFRTAPVEDIADGQQIARTMRAEGLPAINPRTLL